MSTACAETAKTRRYAGFSFPRGTVVPFTDAGPHLRSAFRGKRWSLRPPAPLSASVRGRRRSGGYPAGLKRNAIPAEEVRDRRSSARRRSSPRRRPLSQAAFVFPVRLRGNSLSVSIQGWDREGRTVASDLAREDARLEMRRSQAGSERKFLHPASVLPVRQAKGKHPACFIGS